MRNGIEYENILRRSNFSNISTCKDPVSALQRMEHDPPHVIITDTAMQDMDGFELASNLREIERAENRFSYIVMISDDLHNKIDYSWQSNVDAIIPRESVPFRLIPQVMSGERLATQTNSLLSNNTLLRNRCDAFESGQLIDPLTGLGNRRQAMIRIDDTVKQIEARGGVISLLLIKIDKIESVRKTHGKEIEEELIISVGHKIRRLVRPLDIVAYFDAALFAVVMQHNDLDDCNSKSYARIRDSLALKSYQTRAGYLQPEISIGACGAGAETGPPKTSSLVAEALSNLKNISATEAITISVLNPFEPKVESGR